MMLNPNMTLLHRFVFVVAVMVLTHDSVSRAAPINYGDFSALTVDYLQVTETATSAGDSEPLFGAPQVIGDQLDFDPRGFTATGVNGTSDTTAGQLNFTLMSKLGRAIKDLTVSEGGDYTLLGGAGTPATNVGYSISLPTITLLEVDGVAITPVSLTPSSVSGSEALPADVGTAAWSLSTVYDMNAALTAAGVPFVFGATKVEIEIDDVLSANSEPGTIAAIAKKDFVVINASTELANVIPEPASTLLLAIAGGAFACSRRRR